jgi:hypothetical protein
MEPGMHRFLYNVIHRKEKFSLPNDIDFFVVTYKTYR